MPADLLLLFVAAQVFLWLSECCGWFEFNEHKGYTVLVAVAVIAPLFPLVLLWLLVCWLFRWRLRFGVRGIVLLTVTLALPFGWLGISMVQAWQQRNAVQYARKSLGAHVEYDYEFDPARGRAAMPPGPPLLREWLGNDFFSRVDNVAFLRATDEKLAHLTGMGRIRSLGIGGTEVAGPGLKYLRCLGLESLSHDGGVITDETLEYVKGLRDLKHLHLTSTKITDAGLEHLKWLHNLRRLELVGAKITDDGLERFKSLPHLERLSLSYNRIGDAGLQHLGQLTQLQCLSLGMTKITSAGMEHLKDLNQLRDLAVDGTQVDDDGLAHLRDLPRLEYLSVAYTQVTDAGLRQLEGSPQFKEIGLAGTKVTAEGVDRLRQALPHCKIWWAPPSTKSER
jgi:hypothetical protein